MSNCPSSVRSAITEISDIPDGVAVTIVLWDRRDLDDLMKLSRLQAQQGEPSGEHHTGLHGGSGGTGHCPIIHVGTTVELQPVTDGVRFEVHALPGNDVAELRRDTRHRAEKLPRFVAR